MSAATLVLLVLISVILCYEANDSVVELRPVGPTHRILSGRSFIVNCMVTDIRRSDDNIQWFKEKSGTLVSGDTSDRVFAQPAGQRTVALYMIRIEKEDESTYTCRVNGQPEAQFNLVVSTPKPITFRDPQTEQHLDAGEPGSIFCHPQGKPAPSDVRWYFNGQRISTSNKGTPSAKYAGEPEGGIRLLSVSPSDAGLYTCSAMVPSTGQLRRLMINVTVCQC